MKRLSILFIIAVVLVGAGLSLMRIFELASSADLFDIGVKFILAIVVLYVVAFVITLLTGKKDETPLVK
jgi:uncharacterized Tic20 family protein